MKKHLGFLIACMIPGWSGAISGIGACTASFPPVSVPSGITTYLNTSSNLQNAINAASSGTLLVLAPGVYNVPTVIKLKSGVSIACQCGATLLASGTNAMFAGNPISNVTVSNCIIDGNNGGPGDESGAVYLDGYSSNIHIANNNFQNWTNTNDFWLWNSAQTYIQDNFMTASWQGVTWRTNAGSNAQDTMIVSDNIIQNMTRMGIETGIGSVVTNFHIDRNNISNITNYPISFGGSIYSGTAYGNIINTNSTVGLEIGVMSGHYNVTVSNNLFIGLIWGISIANSPGSAILNNTFTNVTHPFSNDGGYNNTEWIGSNTINGAIQIGWPGHTYGAQPTLYAPSVKP